MSKGNAQLMIVACCVVAVCLTVIYTLLFISLWPYKEYVGGSLLGIVLLLAVVYAKGKLNEQAIRQQRFRHHEETPLDGAGEPMMWRGDMQPNPYRQQYPQQEQYQRYRQQ